MKQGILDTETKDILEEKLKAHEKETSNQVVVLIIPSRRRSLRRIFFKSCEHWKLGTKEKRITVFCFIAKDDRLLRIEVGYGLEGVLTDALCSRIIRKEITLILNRGIFP